MGRADWAKFCMLTDVQVIAHMNSSFLSRLLPCLENYPLFHAKYTMHHPAYTAGIGFR